MSAEKPAKILSYFATSTLAEPAIGICTALAGIADEIDATLPESAEKSAGLRKLIEAYDCVVRAAKT